MVIDLAVENNDPPTRGNAHRLTARGRKFDNGKAVEKDLVAFIRPKTRVIRTAMLRDHAEFEQKLVLNIPHTAVSTNKAAHSYFADIAAPF